MRQQSEGQKTLMDKEEIMDHHKREWFWEQSQRSSVIRRLKRGEGLGKILPSLENYKEAFAHELDIIVCSDERVSAGNGGRKIGLSGYLGAIGKKFVLGRWNVWIPKGTDQGRSFVRVLNNSAYPHDLVLTPNSAVDVKYHLKGKTIDERTNLERVELQGISLDNFPERVFRTYYSLLVHKFSGRDEHFLLYRVCKDEETA